MTRRENSFPFAASQAGLYTQIALLLRGTVWTVESNYVGMIPGRKYQSDVAIPDLKISAEYNGLFLKTGGKGGHQTVAGLTRDWAKANEAQLNGWIYLQFGPQETRTGDAALTVNRAILKRLEEHRELETRTHRDSDRAGVHGRDARNLLPDHGLRR